MSDDQDWTSVTLKKSSAPKMSNFKSNQEVSSAKASGLVGTEKRYGSGGNTHAGTSGNLRKIEESTDTFAVKHVDKELSKAISQARNAKQMTQAQLATAINEKAQTIQQYENGQAVPNGQVIVRLEKVLGVHLPRAKK